MINQEEYFESVASYKLLAKHEVGQNFLIDQDVAKKIISFLEIKEGDHILEIGSGAGSLSFFLAQYDEPIDLIDIDEALVTKLQHDLKKRATSILKWGMRCVFQRVAIAKLLVIFRITLLRVF